MPLPGRRSAALLKEKQWIRTGVKAVQPALYPLEKTLHQSTLPADRCSKQGAANDQSRARGANRQPGSGSTHQESR